MTTTGKSNRSLFHPSQVPDPPPGTVWVEWVGEASPLDDPVVGFNLITGRYTEDQKAVIRGLCRHRVARVHGHRRRLTPDQIPGLSQVWIWGRNERARPGQRGSFMQALPFADADKVKSARCGYQFLIWNERDGEQQSILNLPNAGSVILVGQETYEDSRRFKRAMGWT